MSRLSTTTGSAPVCRPGQKRENRSPYRQIYVNIGSNVWDPWRNRPDPARSGPIQPKPTPKVRGPIGLADADCYYGAPVLPKFLLTQQMQESPKSKDAIILWFNFVGIPACPSVMLVCVLYSQTYYPSFLQHRCPCKACQRCAKE